MAATSRSPRTSWWAVALSIVPTGVTQVAAVVLARRVLRTTRGDVWGAGSASRARAYGALVVTAVWVFVVVGGSLLGLFDHNEDDSGATRDARTGNVDSPGLVGAGSLRDGDCLAVPPHPGINETANGVPCTTEHRAEVYAHFDEPGRYPGDAALVKAASQGCDQRRAALGHEKQLAKVKLTLLLPPDASSFSLDPQVTCLIESDRPLTFDPLD